MARRKQQDYINPFQLTEHENAQVRKLAKAATKVNDKMLDHAAATGDTDSPAYVKLLDRYESFKDQLRTLLNGQAS